MKKNRCHFRLLVDNDSYPPRIGVETFVGAMQGEYVSFVMPQPKQRKFPLSVSCAFFHHIIFTHPRKQLETSSQHIRFGGHVRLFLEECKSTLIEKEGEEEKEKEE